MNKPVVTARERSPFGDIDPQEALAAASEGRDFYHLPGYTDKRIKRELDQRDGKPTTPLTHRYQVANVQDLKGQPTVRNTSNLRQQGYRPVKASEVKSLGITIEGTNYAAGVDGNIYVNGEGMLMVCDAKNAAFNYVKNQQMIDAQSDGVRARVEDAVENFNAKLGLKGAAASKSVFEIEEQK